MDIRYITVVVPKLSHSGIRPRQVKHSENTRECSKVELLVQEVSADNSLHGGSHKLGRDESSLRGVVENILIDGEGEAALGEVAVPGDFGDDSGDSLWRHIY